MIRIRPSLGQAPPGEVVMASASPVQNLAECKAMQVDPDSPEGQLYNNGNICCVPITREDGSVYSFCRKTTFGGQETTPTTETASTITDTTKKLVSSSFWTSQTGVLTMFLSAAFLIAVGGVFFYRARSK